MNDPLGDGISSVQLVQSSGDDLMTVNAARVSLAAFSNGTTVRDEGSDDEWKNVPTDADAKLLKYLLKQGHWSPFEHCHVTLRVKVPLFVRSQIIRHKSASFNEVSGRYTEVKDEVFTPQLFRKQASSNRQASVEADDTLDQDTCFTIWGTAVMTALDAYCELLERGVTREQARGILPQAMYTEFLMTAPLRTWLHLFDQRIHEGAQYETQKVAEAMRDLIAPLFPVTFAAYASLKKEN